MPAVDVIIVGGGLLGMATAYAFATRYPDHAVVLLEKDPVLASQQSGVNAGFVHAGVDGAARSHKAYHVRYGKGLLRTFCREHNIHLRETHQLFVAISDAEKSDLLRIYRRATANGVDCELVDGNALRDIEPHVHGRAGIFVSGAATVDFGEISRVLRHALLTLGVTLITDCQALAVAESDQGVIVQTTQDVYAARVAVNAAGTRAIRLARSAGVDLPLSFVPFRHDYFRATSNAADLVRGAVFPVTDGQLPFSGIHLVRSAPDTLTCGPNALLVAGREPGLRTRLPLSGLLRAVGSGAVRTLTRRHLATAAWEFRRSMSRELFAMTLQRLLPELASDDLEPASSGVSVYAVSKDGTIEDDFVLVESHRMVHALSVPAPGATAAFSLARTFADKLAKCWR